MVLLQRKLYFFQGSRGGSTFPREGVQLFPGVGGPNHNI